MPCDKRLDQREAHDVFNIPTTKRGNAGWVVVVAATPNYLRLASP